MALAQVNIDWQQRAVALDALCSLSLHLLSNKAWQVRQSGLRIVSPTITASGGASGATPEDAILAQWSRFVTDLKPDEYLQVDHSDPAIPVRWNGFMWAPLPKEQWHRGVDR